MNFKKNNNQTNHFCWTDEPWSVNYMYATLKQESNCDFETDEGVEGGDGATPPDPRGEPLQDPFHLRAQDQEASRVLGEAQSRVSWGGGSEKRSCQIVGLYSYSAGQVWEDVGKIYVWRKVFWVVGSVKNNPSSQPTSSPFSTDLVEFWLKFQPIYNEGNFSPQ